MSLSVEGVDYSFARPDPTGLRRAGYRFAMRYLGFGEKVLTRSELERLWAAGLSVGVVWETTAGRALSGHAGGESDAHRAADQARSLGLAGIPIYFAVDFDATPSQQGAINDYFRGVTSVIGKDRTGVYAGYWPLKRLFEAGLITWGWQTYAWSGGNVSRRAHIYQWKNGVSLAGGQVDLNKAVSEAGLRGPAIPHPANGDPRTKREKRMCRRRCEYRHKHLHAKRGTREWTLALVGARYFKGLIRFHMNVIRALARAQSKGWERHKRGARYQLLAGYLSGKSCK